MIDISYEGVKEAKERIEKYIYKTPLLRVEALDEVLNCKVYLKPENFQKTGSFKLRGALNKILSLNEDERKRGIVASSSGNHAQGVAYAAKMLGIDAKIVMPENVNPVKLENVKKLGATAVLVDTNPSSREEKVKEIIEKENRVEVHPYQDKFVKEGQGTISLEVLEDNKNINKIVVPVSGGGLLSGVAVGAKGINSNIKVIAAEPEKLNRYKVSSEKNELVELENSFTIADGTRNNRANPINFPIIKEYVDDYIYASDEEIKEAIRLVAKNAKIIIEPSSALVFSAFMNGRVDVNKNDEVCFVISGGNNDISLLADILKGE